MVNKNLRFLIYGAGVIGSIFAGKLSGAGYHVTVLARNNRFDELKANGIILRNSMTEEKEYYQVGVTNQLSPEDTYDYIIVVMQKNQVNNILPILAKNKTPNIVFVVNNASGYDHWFELLGKDRVMLGFPAAGGERNNGEITYFVGRGLSKLFQATTFGEIDDSISPRLKILVKAFNIAGFSPRIEGNMEAWQKTHVALIIPIANSLYKYNGDNYSLGKSYKDIKIMLMAVREGLDALKTIGVAITPGKLKMLYWPLPLLTPIFQLLMSSKKAEITMAKHAVAAKNEMLQLQKEFQLLIEESKVQTPIFDELAKYNQDSLEK